MGKLEGAAIALPGQDTSSEEMEVRLSGDASSEEEGTQPMDLLETGKREGAAVLEPALPASPASETSDMDVVLVGARAHPVHSVQRAADAHLDAFCRQAIAEHGLEDSFYVLDLGIVQRRHEVWTSLLPRVTPFYAVKANPDPVLLKTLALLGAGFDVASEAELNLVLSLGGVDPGKRVVYANACKRPRDLCHMAEKSADLTTFDTCSELRKIARHHAGAQCLLRIRADDPDARCQLGNKYGAEMEDVPELVALAKELGLQLVGVSFHVGSGASNPNAFTAAIRLAHDVFSTAWQVGFKDMEILDIGGREGVGVRGPAAHVEAHAHELEPELLCEGDQLGHILHLRPVLVPQLAAGVRVVRADPQQALGPRVVARDLAELAAGVEGGQVGRLLRHVAQVPRPLAGVGVHHALP